MNIYLVKRSDDTNWDEYESFVIVAKDDVGARQVAEKECCGRYSWNKTDFYGVWSDIKLLGKSAKGLKEGEIVHYQTRDG